MVVLKLSDFNTGKPIFINFQNVLFFEEQEKDGRPYTYIQFVGCSTKVIESENSIESMLQ